jgi:cytochrome c551/c552
MLKSKHFILSLLTFNTLNADSIGSLLFHGNCTTCHNETKTISAPSMVSVRKHYRDAFYKKKDFVKYMSIFVANPNKEISIMLQSVQKHGIMPHLGFEEEALKEIVEYIYDTDFTKKHDEHNKKI